YDEVVAGWRRCIAHAYNPERLFARFAHQVDATYANRMDVPARGKLTVRNLREAVVLGFNIVLWIGLLSNYRRPFWRAAWHALSRGQVDAALGMGLVAYHLVRFSREASRRTERIVLFCAWSSSHGAATRRCGRVAVIPSKL